MAVCRQDRKTLYTSNPIPTPFRFLNYAPRLLGNNIVHETKRSRDGVTCIVFLCPVLPTHYHLYT